jgi:hypothetical protein
VTCAVDSINKLTEEFNTYDIPPSCIQSYYIGSIGYRGIPSRDKLSSKDKLINNGN